MNAYIQFTNESIHALETLRERLEEFNRTANAYLADQGGELVFKVSDFHQELTFQHALIGVCAITHPGASHELSLRALYERTIADNAPVPAGPRAQFNQSRDGMMYILIEVFSLADSLEAFVRRRPAPNEAELLGIFSILQRCEVLFHDFDAARASLQYLAQTQASPLPAGLKELQELVSACRRVVIGVRYSKWQSLEAALAQLDEAMLQAEAAMVAQEAQLESLGLNYRQTGTGYRNVLVHAGEIRKKAKAFLEQRAFPSSYAAYGAGYYYYNDQLLAAFNHRKYGLLAYYNRFLSFANQPMPLQVEECPEYKVVFPSLLFAQTIEKNALRSSPEIGARAAAQHPLAGAAPANLVFLLDVSASMRQPGRMDLMRAAILRMAIRLRPEDQVSIVVFAGAASVALPPTPANQVEEISKALSTLNFSGKTDPKKGLKAAYQVAKYAARAADNTRVLFVTDGDFRVDRGMSAIVRKGKKQSVGFTVLMFGRKTDPDHPSALVLLAMKNLGRYVYVQPEDIDRVLIEEAAGWGNSESK